MGTSQINKSYWIKIGLTCLIPILIYMMPCNELFTQQIKLFFAVTCFFICTIAFEIFPLMVPAVLMPISYILLSIAPAATVFNPWLGTTWPMLIGAYLIAIIMDEVGLLKRISYWLAIKTGGSYKGIVYAVFFVAVAISFMTSANGHAIVAAFCFGICRALELDRRAANTVMMIGLFTCTSAHNYIYQPMLVSAMVNNAKIVDPSFNITWIGFFLDNILFIPFCLIFAWLMMKFYKPEEKSVSVSGKEYFIEQYAALGKISAQEKKTAIVAVLLLVFFLTERWHGLATAYAFILIPWLLYLPGINVGTVGHIKKINYELIIFSLSCVSIGAVASSVGVGNMIVHYLVPIIQPLASIWDGFTYIVVYIYGGLLNILLTPLSLVSVSTVPLLHIAEELALNAKGILYALYYSTEVVFFPHETTPYLIFFSFGVVGMKDFIKIATVKSIVYTIFMILIMFPFWKLLGVM